MLQLQKMNNFFPDFITDGIFTKLFNNDYTPEWLDTIEKSQELNILYHTNFSYTKLESVLLYNTRVMQQPDTLIYNSIINIFSLKWEKLYNTLKLEYNPIWNVDGTEERTIISNDNDTVNKSAQYDKDETIENNITHTVTNDTNISNISAFNSETFSPLNESIRNGSETSNELTTNIANNKDVENIVNVKDHTTKETFKRGGNIGVTSTQHLIEEERNTWQYSFYEEVFKDIDSILTSPYWG